MHSKHKSLPTASKCVILSNHINLKKNCPFKAKTTQKNLYCLKDYIIQCMEWNGMSFSASKRRQRRTESLQDMVPFRDGLIF